MASFQEQLPFTLRDAQQAHWDKDWFIRAFVGGRGAGTTLAAAVAVSEAVHERGVKHVAIIGRTHADFERTLLNGPSGLCNIGPEDLRPQRLPWPHKYRIEWPNGAVGYCLSADNPNEIDTISGSELTWCDGLSYWPFPVDKKQFSLWEWLKSFLTGSTKDEAPKEWSMWQRVLLRTHSGKDPRILISTTPGPRINGLLRELSLSNEAYLTRETTFDNADNLPPDYVDMMREYANERFGKQEIHAEFTS